MPQVRLTRYEGNPILRPAALTPRAAVVSSQTMDQSKVGGSRRVERRVRALSDERDPA